MALQPLTKSPQAMLRDDGAGPANVSNPSADIREEGLVGTAGWMNIGVATR